MKSQTWVNMMKITVFVAVIAAIIITLWTSLPAAMLLATVSWNG